MCTPLNGLLASLTFFHFFQKFYKNFAIILLSYTLYIIEGVSKPRRLFRRIYTMILLGRLSSNSRRPLFYLICTI